ncbi:MAG: PEP-CTERM sorting domain-containing protein [Syntrophobacter sp.]
MKKTLIAFIGLSLILFGYGVSYGVPFTNDHNFGGTGLFRANDYTRVDDRSGNSFTFDHVLDPSAGTITSGSLTLNYSRVSPWTRTEKWFVFVGDYKLGRLTGRSGKKWLSQTFVLPSALLDSINTSSLEIRLVESTKGHDSFFLNRSDLSLQYRAPDPGSSTPVPEPSTSFLLGFGLVGLIAYRRLQN